MRSLNAIFRPAHFTGWHMLGVISLFFGTIISVNLVLAFNAATTWTGLVVKNTYVESQNFNARLDQLAAQSTLGWTAALERTRTGLAVQIRNDVGTLAKEIDLKEIDLIGFLGRPVHEGADVILSFAAKGDQFVAETELEPGLWRVQLVARHAGDEIWTKTVRFTAPDHRARSGAARAKSDP